MSTGHDLLATLMAEELNPQSEPEIQRVVTFNIKRFVLQILLEKAITVVPTRDVMPALKCFQFVVDPQRLRVVASDCELSLICSTPMISVTWPGTAVFPARKLLEIVKSSEDGDVKITVLGTTATIEIGRASWTLKLPGGDDYPPLPAISEAEFTAVDKDSFRDAITAVRYAASRDPSRANLNIIDIHDGKLTASDGSRIQQIQVSDFPVSLRIPISAVDDLLRLLKMCDLDTIHVGQSEDHLIFRFGSDVFIVSKFRAQFPDMEEQMLRPALGNKHELDVDRHELVAAIKRVRINADTDTSAIALTLQNNQLTISTKDKFGNTAGESIDAVWSGGPRALVVNHRFLTDMIRTYGDITCTFKLGDDTVTRKSPLMLKNNETGSVGVCQQMMSDWVGM